MKELSTEINIDATAEKVWRILTDFGRYHEWNPFIKEAAGVIEEGSQLRVYIVPPNGSGMTFKPTVTRLISEREFRWQGRLILPGLFDGEHIFEITPKSNDGVKFVQREYFRGLLVPLLWRIIEANTRKGFEEMNGALKRRAEGK